MKFKIIFLVFAIIFSISCSRKEKNLSQSDKISMKATSTVKEAFALVSERSLANNQIDKMSDSDKKKLKITKTDDDVSIIYRSKPELKEKDFIVIKKITDSFNDKTRQKLLPTSCINIYDPMDLNDPDLYKTDYYSRATTSIVKVANELATIDNIFEFVKTDIKNSQLYGATQSANTLLKTKSGSVVDKANLLMALFKSQKIPARIVYGETYLTLPAAKRFLKAPYVSDVFLTLYLVFGNYFISNNVLGSNYFQNVNGENYITIPHVWVRAYNGTSWQNYDPTVVSDVFLYKEGRDNSVDIGSVDWNNWFFGPDANGDYIKPKTVIDFLLEGITLNKEIHFTNGRDEYSGARYYYGVLSEISPCARGTLNTIENSGNEFRANVKLTDASGNVVFSTNQPAAKLSEDKSYFSHTAGLYSELSNPATGTVQFKIGDELIGEFASPTGNLYNVSVDFYSPSNFIISPYTHVFATKHKSGGVMQINVFARPTEQIDLIEGIDNLKSDVESSKPSKIIMADVHRLAGILFNFRLTKAVNDIYLLRGVKFLRSAVFLTNTNDGVLSFSGNESKELGFVPTMPGIDALSFVPMVNGPFDLYSYDGWKSALSNAYMESITSGSDNEATVWEQLFGLRGYSTVRALQLAGLEKSYNPSAYNFIQGVEFNSTDSANIRNQIDPNSQLMMNWPSILTEFGSPGNFYWGPNKEVTDSTTGTVVLAYLVDGGIFNSSGAMFRILNVGSSQVFSSFSDVESSTLKKMENQHLSSQNFKKENDNISDTDTNYKPLGGGGGNHSEPPIPTDQGKTPNVGPKTSDATPGMSSCNPVDYASGLMWHHFDDFNLRGRTQETGLFFKRTYYTLPQYQQAGNWVTTGDFGKGWVHSFDSRLLDGSKNGSGDLLMGPLTSGTGSILWITETGNTVLFEYNSSTQTYSPPQGFIGKLEVSGSTYVLTRKKNIKYIFKKDLASNFNGRLIKIQDPHGEELNMYYDSNGRLQSVNSTFAGDLVFNRDSNNRIVSIKNPKNNLEVTYEYENGLLASSSDFDKRKTAYQYNSAQVGTKANGLLKSIIDPLNREIRFEYYQNGKVLREVGHGGAEQVYQYAPYLYQKFTRVMGPNGQTSEYRYDNKFRVIQENRPDGSRIYRKWTASGNIEWEKDGLGNKYEFTYDSRNNQTGIKKPLNSNFAQIDYDQIFDKPIMIKPLVGSSTAMTLNSSGEVTSVTRDLYESPVISNFTYDSYGTLLATKTSLNSYSDYADSNGFKNFIFHSRNPIQIKYDGRGRVIENRFANGRVQRFSYDNYDRVTFSEDTNGPSYRNYYDIGGRLIKQDRMAGNLVQSATFSYDERDRLISSSNFAGEKTEYKYDIVGAGCQIRDTPVRVTQADGKSIRFEYDEVGRKTKEVYQDGTFVLYGYNLRGDLIYVMDSAGNLSQYEYDANQRLVKILNQSAGWQLNLVNNKVGYMPEMVIFTYDEADRVKTKEQILSNELITNGRYVTEFQYDNLDRLIKKSIMFKRGSKVVESFDEITYEYLRILNPTLINQISNKYLKLKFNYETQPPYSLISYSEEPTTLGSSLNIKSHEYKVVPDKNGPMALISRDGAPSILQTYDLAGRILSVKGNFNNLTNTATNTYDPLGRKTNTVNTQGTSASYTYDNADRVTSIGWTGTPAITESLVYTKAGLIEQMTREIGTFDFKYTSKNEASNISYSGSESLNSAYVNTSLVYDSAGNLTNYSNRQFFNFNNFVQQVFSGGTNNFYYPSSDGLGRVQFKYEGTNTHDFKYYPEGQLKKFRVFDSAGTITKTVDYYYDGLGRRIAKVSQTQGQSPFYLTYSHLGAEDKILFASLTQGTNTKEVLYVDGQGIDDHFFEISTDTGVKIYKKDHLGSVLNSAAIGGKSVYGIYGENLGTAVSASTYTEPVTYGFTGREYDNETGFYYYRARSYDPQTAKFLTKDPLGPETGGDINPYRYVHNDPVNRTDPSGMIEPISGTAILVGAGIGGVAGGVSAYLSGARDFNTIATASVIGAAAGATSVIAGVYTAGVGAAMFVNGVIGGGANLATQVATSGTNNINYTSLAIATGTGAIGGGLGSLAGTTAFFSTPVIGNPTGIGAAISNKQVVDALTSGVGGGVLDYSLNRTCH